MTNGNGKFNIIPNGPSDLFDNNSGDPACDILPETCTLKGGDCESTVDETKFKLLEGAIVEVDTDRGGYPSFCMLCSNGVQTISSG